MDDIELNKALHEWMGECWHEFYPQSDECNKCNTDFGRLGTPYIGERPEYHSYTTNPADYWRLLKKVKKHKKWQHFKSFGSILKESSVRESIIDTLLDMPRGARAIFDFFCKEGK